MKFEEAKSTYWKYYISLEEQFIYTSKYVEFDYINNAKTYSMEFLKLFQATCSEIDVVGKILSKLLDKSFSSTKYTGINEWWYHIIQNDMDFIQRECLLFDGHTIKPWNRFMVVKNENKGAKKYILDESFKPKSKTPTWWLDYNKVKHNRTGKFGKHSNNYSKANLKNLFYSFAALYSLEVKLMESVMSDNDVVPLEMESKLFVEDLHFYTHLLSVF